METDIIRNGSGKAESRCNDVGATSIACHPEPQLLAAKDLCTPSHLDRSSAAKNAAQDDKAVQYAQIFLNLRPSTWNLPPSTILIASVYATCSCSKIRVANACSSSESSTGTVFCTMIAP